MNSLDPVESGPFAQLNFPKGAQEISVPNTNKHAKEAEAWRQQRNLPRILDQKRLNIHRPSATYEDMPGVVEAARKDVQPENPPQMLSFDQAVEPIKSGDTVFVGNHFRLCDPSTAQLMYALARGDKEGVTLASHLLYKGEAMDAVTSMLERGIVQRLECGAFYGPLGAKVSRGELSFPVMMYGYGGRTSMLRTGQLAANWVFSQVPYADQYGKTSGVMGPEYARCGNTSLISDDARYATDGYAVVAQEIGSRPILDGTGSHCYPETMIQLAEKTLSNKGIAGGTTDPLVIQEKLKKNPRARSISDNVMKVLEASELLKPRVNFQVGAGTVSLAALYQIVAHLEKNKIKAGYCAGGIMPIHLEMLEKGLVDTLLDGQAFAADIDVYNSLASNPKHRDTTLWEFYCATNAQSLVRQEDFSILGVLEVDTSFNTNVLTGRNGILRGGLGGAQDAAAAKLSIITTPLTNYSKKAGIISPNIVSDVVTVTSPGSDIDVIVTEKGIAINPQSKSPYIDTLKTNAIKKGLEVIAIEDLHAMSLKEAQALAQGNPGANLLIDPATCKDRVVALVHDRYGRVIDAVREVA